MARFLNVLRDESLAIPPADGRPTPSQVLYAQPNTNNTRKQCGNCFMWISASNGCVIHDPHVEVIGDDICGYHVAGTPLMARPQQPIEFVSPLMSGLENVPGGSSCDVCRNYEPSGKDVGTCRAVRDEVGADAVVGAKGCCAAWEQA